MADDLHYIGGDNYLLDDLSGFKIRASRARIIPGGQTGQLAVAPERWEPQQPQDFVRGVWDDETVQIARPRQTNRFTYVATNVSAPSVMGAGQITVAATDGFVAGDNIQVMLDSGDNFQTSIAALSGANIMYLGTPLPGSVGLLYGDPIENLVVFLNGGPPAYTGLYNDGGVLAIIYPSLIPPGPGALPAGSVYDTGGTVGIVPGVGPGTLVVLFGQATQGFLLVNGGGQLPASAPSGSGQLYNNGGEIAIA